MLLLFSQLNIFLPLFICEVKMPENEFPIPSVVTKHITLFNSVASLKFEANHLAQLYEAKCLNKIKRI